MSTACQLLAVRLLAVMVIGGCLALGLDGAEELVRFARVAAACAALAIALVVLVVVAAARPVPPGRRMAIAASLTGVAAGAFLGGAVAALFPLAGGAGWILVAAVTVGLAIGARAGLEAERRLTSDAATLSVDPDDVYAAHVLRLRARGALARAADRPTAVRESLEAIPIAWLVLAPGLGGLALLALLRGLVALDAAQGLVFLVLIVAVPAVGFGVGLAGLLMTLPLSVVVPSVGATGRRRLAQRVSRIQPLPDLLASALVSLLVQSGPTRRPPDGQGGP